MAAERSIGVGVCASALLGVTSSADWAGGSSCIGFGITVRGSGNDMETLAGLACIGSGSIVDD